MIRSIMIHYGNFIEMKIWICLTTYILSSCKEFRFPLNSPLLHPPNLIDNKKARPIISILNFSNWENLNHTPSKQSHIVSIMTSHHVPNIPLFSIFIPNNFSYNSDETYNLYISFHFPIPFSSCIIGSHKIKELKDYREN